MDKFDSQSKNKKTTRDREADKVTSLPLQKKADRPALKQPTAPDSLHDEELQKDLELLAKMRERIDQLPDIDTARIVQLHERIIRGEYNIDTKSLAKKLGQFESDLHDPSS
ncbi:MAG: flagellar biosynthesis anti-sigma factor FlgM [Gammaproteobacteria bacterium]